MSSFSSSLEGKLAAMEQRMQALGELDSIVTRLDRSKLASLLSRLNQDCDELFDKHFATQRLFPYIFQSKYPYIRPMTSEDLSRWREQYKSKVLVVIGDGRVEVVAAADLAKECKATVSRIVLSWDQYQKLFDGIDSLISEDEEPLAIGQPKMPS